MRDAFQPGCQMKTIAVMEANSGAEMCLSAEVNVGMNDCCPKGCRVALWSLSVVPDSFESGSLNHESVIWESISPFCHHHHPTPSLKASSIVHNLDFVPTSLELHHIKGFYKSGEKSIPFPDLGVESSAFKLIPVLYILQTNFDIRPPPLCDMGTRLARNVYYGVLLG